jgi:hypothetical protein
MAAASGAAGDLAAEEVLVAEDFPGEEAALGAEVQAEAGRKLNVKLKKNIDVLLLF